VEHDLFRKPLHIPDRGRGHAFRDHALATPSSSEDLAEASSESSAHDGEEHQPRPAQLRSRRRNPVNVSQIRYFIALCRELNFTRAARSCRVSQPSLSNGIRALESELGGPVFDRSSMALTRLGKRVLPDLENVLSSIERAHRTAATVRRHETSRTLAEVKPARRFDAPEAPAQMSSRSAVQPPSGAAGSLRAGSAG
jgi:Bacterial regulatory helix-turn-helix protein, lysR family